LTQKIAHFGIWDKYPEIQLYRSAVIGEIFKYMPPELMELGIKYVCTADIFSLAFILFEMFSGQPAEKDLVSQGSHPFYFMRAIFHEKRPTLWTSSHRVCKSRWNTAGLKIRPKGLHWRSFEKYYSPFLATRHSRASTPSVENKHLVKIPTVYTETAKFNLPLPVLSINSAETLPEGSSIPSSCVFRWLKQSSLCPM